MNDLKDYFHAPLYEKALNNYYRIARDRNWGLDHKLDLYNLAKIAFDTQQSDSNKFLSFNEIYENLKKGWRIFRNAQRGYWSSEEVYIALTNYCFNYSRTSTINLKTETLENNINELYSVLIQLKDLKPASEYPWMPVAKFTHFYNPKLFPIYDYEVVWCKVMNGIFRDDYRKWCKKNQYNRNGPGAYFNIIYILWAGDLIRQADDDFMEKFSIWFRKMVGSHSDKQGVLSEIEEYYATAFEFVAIGAAYL